jgi:DHA2 family multidrug resistance protein-like MFS transporter
MNDATRELGAALGVGVVGWITPPHYSHSVGPAVDAVLTGPAAADAKTALADALHSAAGLPGAAGARLAAVANDAFVGGIHVAMLVGVGFAMVAAAASLRFLPRTIRHAVPEPVGPYEVEAEGAAC